MKLKSFFLFWGGGGVEELSKKFAKSCLPVLVVVLKSSKHFHFGQFPMSVGCLPGLLS